MPQTLEPITPTPQDARFAREGSRVLARLQDRQGEVHLRPSDAGEEEITLPLNVVRLVREVLDCIAQGQTVAILPMSTEVTTNEAADVLGVSRPYLIKLLQNGEIAFHQVGTKRRIPLADLLRYRDENKARRLTTLAELQAQAQELHMGY